MFDLASLAAFAHAAIIVLLAGPSIRIHTKVVDAMAALAPRRRITYQFTPYVS